MILSSQHNNTDRYDVHRLKPQVYRGALNESFAADQEELDKCSGAMGVVIAIAQINGRFGEKVVRA